jgi:hypothetical protein
VGSGGGGDVTSPLPSTPSVHQLHQLLALFIRRTKERIAPIKTASYQSKTTARNNYKSSQKQEQTTATAKKIQLTLSHKMA